jgi:hypothetical protein
MRFDNEFGMVLGQPFAQLMELVLEQDDAKMRHRDIILVYVAAVFLRSEGIVNMGYHEVMVVELISDLTSRPADLLGSDGPSVEEVSCL